MSRETEIGKIMEQQLQPEKVDQRVAMRESRFEALGIPEPKLDVEADQFKVLFDPKYALQPENYKGGVEGFYKACFDRLGYQQENVDKASASTLLGWLHNNTVLGACTELRCNRVVQRETARRAEQTGFLDVS